ncbi:unnamed protein product [Linum trigynum]|uniref:Uncharacterized protein n=1 Tax=Linum trigynum TaxID=586398 RepID=A0AAV2F0T6_9ROSI
MLQKGVIFGFGPRYIDNALLMYGSSRQTKSSAMNWMRDPWTVQTNHVHHFEIWLLLPRRSDDDGRFSPTKVMRIESWRVAANKHLWLTKISYALIS